MFEINNPLNPARSLALTPASPREAEIRQQQAEADAQDKQAIHDILSQNLEGPGEKKGKKQSGGVIGGLNSAFGEGTSPTSAKPGRAKSSKGSPGPSGANKGGKSTGGSGSSASSKK